MLSLEEPDEDPAGVNAGALTAQAAGQIENFFDNMAFQPVEAPPRGTPNEASSWSVTESAGPGAPQAAAAAAVPAAPTEDAVKPLGVVDDDDIPVVMGNDLPVVHGRSPTKDPFNGLDWIVGEPAKK